MRYIFAAILFSFSSTISFANSSSQAAWLFFQNRVGCFKTLENISQKDRYTHIVIAVDTTLSPTQYSFVINEYRLVGSVSYSVKPTIWLVFNFQDRLSETSGAYTHSSFECGRSGSCYFKALRISGIQADGTYTFEVGQSEKPLSEPIDFSTFNKTVLVEKIQCPGAL